VTDQQVPRVSICSQIYNQKEMAMDMISSVVAQTFENWELIIVDDGSTDGLQGAIELNFQNEARIRFIRFEENKGIPFGINHALALANGEFVCLLAADETLDKYKLEQQLHYLDEHKDVDCLWGMPGVGDFGQRPEWEQYFFKAHNRSNEAWLRTLINLEHVPIGGCSLMMKRSVMHDLGYMNENLTMFSDHELYCRFFEKGYKGHLEPVRWARDRGQPPENSVRTKNADRAAAELEYVRNIHPLKYPKTGGLVSVLIPCYNQGKYLDECVASVLAQDYPEIEILVLNDGSTDETEQAIKELPEGIRGFGWKNNEGIQAALNYMTEQANGDFICVLAADDTFEPDTISKLMAKFKENPWIEFAATQTNFMSEDGKLLSEDTQDDWARKLMSVQKPVNKSSEDWLKELLGGNQYFGAGMYRKQAVIQIGGWKKEYKVISDYEMYIALLQRENIAVVEEPLTHTRVHGNQYSALNQERSSELPMLYGSIRRRYWPPAVKVYIATPFYELKGFSPYIISLIHTIKLLTMLGIQYEFTEISGDSYIHRARNTIVDAFLRDPDATDIFFIDSDMAWDPNAFVNMLLLPDPIIGGAYPVKNKWEEWTSIPMQVPEEGGKIGMRGRPLKDGSALIQAHVLSGGFLRVKRDVFLQFQRQYRDKWYTEPSTRPDEPGCKYFEYFYAGRVPELENKFFGEDHYFSHMMRGINIPMMIYPNATITHWGYKDFTGNFHQWLRKRTDEAAQEATVQ